MLPSRLFICLTLVATGNLVAQTPTSGAVDGVIVHVEDHSPLAQVQLRLIGPSFPRYLVSDAEGRFHFVLLPPGIWTLETPGIHYGDAEVIHPNRLKKIKIKAGKTIFIKVEVRSIRWDPMVTRPTPLDFTSQTTELKMESKD